MPYHTIIAALLLVILWLAVFYSNKRQEVKGLRLLIASGDENHFKLERKLREEYHSAHEAIIRLKKRHEFMKSKLSLKNRKLLEQIYRLHAKLIESQGLIDALTPMANDAAQLTNRVVQLAYNMHQIADRGLRDHKIIPVQACREILAVEAPLEQWSKDMMAHIERVNELYAAHHKRTGAYAVSLALRQAERDDNGGKILNGAKITMGAS